MMRELHGVISEIAADASVRVLVLRGEGADFCPGADVKHYGGAGAPAAARARLVAGHRVPGPGDAARDARRDHRGHQRRLRRAGFGWACACDLRIASETAKFNSAFLDVGVAGDMGGPWTLPRILGAAKARELYFLPGKFDAAEALRIGLVSKVSAAADFEADLAALTARLARAAPLALATMKANFLAAEKMAFPTTSSWSPKSTCASSRPKTPPRPSAPSSRSARPSSTAAEGETPCESAKSPSSPATSIASPVSSTPRSASTSPTTIRTSATTA
jgi:2-(1,2-epoxy-1,2-dihydrophenyl)acetyl-CoA isomerase